MRLAGKVSIVTGATSGIGRAIAVAYGREGSKVVAIGRDEERLEGVKKEIQEPGGECTVVAADLTSVDSAKKVVAKAVEAYGGVDVLVNCAGVFELADFFEVDESFFSRTMDVNIRSMFFMSQQAGLEMKKKGKGKIINLSSIGGGQIGFPTGSVYCASKAAIAALTQTLGIELAPHNIMINAISPGNIRTPMNEHLLANPDYLQAMMDMTPLKRIGETTDITPMAVYLASSESDYMTGQQVVIDGGVSCG